MKTARILAAVFGVLTFCGVIYVLITGGRANAGYAIIPMALCLAFFAAVRKRPK